MNNRSGTFLKFRLTSISIFLDAQHVNLQVPEIQLFSNCWNFRYWNECTYLRKFQAGLIVWRSKCAWEKQVFDQFGVPHGHSRIWKHQLFPDCIGTSWLHIFFLEARPCIRVGENKGFSLLLAENSPGLWRALKILCCWTKDEVL